MLRRPRRPSPRHFGAAALAALLILTLAAAVIAHQHTVQRTHALADSLYQATRAHLAGVPPLGDPARGRLRTFLNEAHLDQGRDAGISPQPARAQLDSLLAAGALVPIATNAFMVVEPMRHSVPAVTPRTAAFLDRLGRRFHAALAAQGLPPFRFIVTSATRTLEDQARLQGRNVNAASESSHYFGTTVDLSYSRFAPPARTVVAPRAGIHDALLRRRLAEDYARLARAEAEALKGLLGRTLLALQQEREVLVIYERRQTVFHLTATGRTPPPTLPAASR